MLIIKEIRELQQKITDLKSQNKSIGFFPTMGALHEGHLTLAKHAIRENDVSICSIFVNPTQFNQKDDLDKYPRTLEKDAALLEHKGVDILFYPHVDEIYPKNEDNNFEFDFNGLDEVLEGAQRPGHFKGVGQIVSKLLYMVNPDRLYMGQKDFQQFSIINYMIDAMKIPTQLRIVPIVREQSGLAMSSRNARLSQDERNKACVIHKTLLEIKELKDLFSVKELETMAMKKFESFNDFRPEYVTISDGYDLKDIKDLSNHEYAIVSTAVWVGDVRLIDNVIIKVPEDNPLFVKE